MSTATPPPILPGAPSHESVADIDLIPLATAGSTDAFTTLFNRHYTAIHAYAYRLCLCSAEAEDVAQETFIQAARSLTSFRREASFKNWLFSIATNRTRDRLRKRRQRDRLDSALANQPAHEAIDHVSLAAGALDSQRAVQAALANLTTDQREAITLVYYENLNHAEAARVLGCAESTVSWRLFRAKTKLRKTLRAHRHD